MPTPLKTLVENEKLIAGSPQWVEQPKNPKDDQMRLVASLMVNGRVLQGLELVGRVRLGIRNAYASFSLIYLPTDSRRDAVRLCRVDWRPLTPHVNDHPNTPADLIGDVEGTHHHSFSLNWAAKSGVPLKALPIAEGINPDYQTFIELLDGVGDLFRIPNAAILPSPWPEDLFS